MKKNFVKLDAVQFGEKLRHFQLTPPKDRELSSDGATIYPPHWSPSSNGDQYACALTTNHTPPYLLDSRGALSTSEKIRRIEGQNYVRVSFCDEGMRTESRKSATNTTPWYVNDERFERCSKINSGRTRDTTNHNASKRHRLSSEMNYSDHNIRHDGPVTLATPPFTTTNQCMANNTYTQAASMRCGHDDMISVPTTKRRGPMCSAYACASLKATKSTPTQKTYVYSPPSSFRNATDRFPSIKLEMSTRSHFPGNSDDKTDANHSAHVKGNRMDKTASDHDITPTKRKCGSRPKPSPKLKEMGPATRYKLPALTSRKGQGNESSERMEFQYKTSNTKNDFSLTSVLNKRGRNDKALIGLGSGMTLPLKYPGCSETPTSYANLTPTHQTNDDTRSSITRSSRSETMASYFQEKKDNSNLNMYDFTDEMMTAKTKPVMAWMAGANALIVPVQRNERDNRSIEAEHSGELIRSHSHSDFFPLPAITTKVKVQATDSENIQPSDAEPKYNMEKEEGNISPLLMRDRLAAASRLSSVSSIPKYPSPVNGVGFPDCRLQRMPNIPGAMFRGTEDDCPLFNVTKRHSLSNTYNKNIIMKKPIRQTVSMAAVPKPIAAFVALPPDVLTVGGGKPKRSGLYSPLPRSHSVITNPGKQLGSNQPPPNRFALEVSPTSKGNVRNVESVIGRRVGTPSQTYVDCLPSSNSGNTFFGKEYNEKRISPVKKVRQLRLAMSPNTHVNLKSEGMPDIFKNPPKVKSRPIGSVLAIEDRRSDIVARGDKDNDNGEKIESSERNLGFRSPPLIAKVHKKFMPKGLRITFKSDRRLKVKPRPIASVLSTEEQTSDIVVRRDEDNDEVIIDREEDLSEPSMLRSLGLVKNEGTGDSTDLQKTISSTEIETKEKHKYYAVCVNAYTTGAASSHVISAATINWDPELFGESGSLRTPDNLVYFSYDTDHSMIVRSITTKDNIKPGLYTVDHTCQTISKNNVLHEEAILRAFPFSQREMLSTDMPLVALGNVRSKWVDVCDDLQMNGLTPCPIEAIRRVLTLADADTSKDLASVLPAALFNDRPIANSKENDLNNGSLELQIRMRTEALTCRCLECRKLGSFHDYKIPKSFNRKAERARPRKPFNIEPSSPPTGSEASPLTYTRLRRTRRLDKRAVSSCSVSTVPPRRMSSKYLLGNVGSLTDHRRSQSTDLERYRRLRKSKRKTIMNRKYSRDYEIEAGSSKAQSPPGGENMNSNNSVTMRMKTRRTITLDILP